MNEKSKINLSEYADELLFSYGTLQIPNVQLTTFGRLLEGDVDRLIGYEVCDVKITDPVVLEKSNKEIHPALVKTGNAGDVVPGTVFKVSKSEIVQADGYEVSDYERVLISLESGKDAWAYVLREV